MNRRTRLAAVALTAVMLVMPATPAFAAKVGPSVAGRSVERVVIDDNAFSPRRIAISRGDVVKWVNRDNLPHTSTSSSWNSGRLDPGETFRRRFRRAGSFSYRCTIHPGMSGTVVVR